MAFTLKIDPAAIAQQFGFKCSLNTSLQTYCQPGQETVGSVKLIHSLLIPQNATFYLCMWCTGSTIHPIGLAVGYIADKIQTEQTSSCSGEKFIIKEEGDYKPHFRTYGMFCSLQCAKAFWLDHRHQMEFKYAGLYLQNIWNAEYSPNLEFIEAPPREMLKVFGGTLDNADFHQIPPKKFTKVGLFPMTLKLHDVG